MSTIEAQPGETLYFSGGDDNDYLYRTEAPQGLRSLLSLPKFQGQHLPDRLREHLGALGDSILTPRLTITPMGRSWALWIAQAALE